MSTSTVPSHSVSTEKPAHAASGWLFLFLTLFAYVAAFSLVVSSIRGGGAVYALLGGLCLVGAILGSCGFFTLQPNESAVLLLFGD